jgi:hypothetical protein
MSVYFPNPNPPSQPKKCQECETVVDGEGTDGWWLEHRNNHGEQYYLLLCLRCACDQMYLLPQYPDSMNVAEAREYLYENDL